MRIAVQPCIDLRFTNDAVLEYPLRWSVPSEGLADAVVADFTHGLTFLVNVLLHVILFESH